ncbi:hypothetical protein BSZ39_06365 [Bowdeniella nasicola]|uniref:2,3,4,5-tetrahydropyridine-2,6-dicarboxylate N-succinyltransferase middle domain-containing protein n=1 Tax=Bowdeniella nasicola TaxID=208480 RepID=A0A1Q5Q2K3_9ACTO|nr:hypothetical protein [Bowdeniella nasicola]OKL54026.1 hypothetical protein BSZ39_06365 [Bowdeniella nasicola]
MPGEVNLEGILDLLPTVVWSDAGPCRATDFETVRAQLRVRNRGVGFSLEDGCQVEAALYLAASTSIRLNDGAIATGADLAGQPRLRFYRDSLSGEVHATACATTSASVTS